MKGKLKKNGKGRRKIEFKSGAGQKVVLRDKKRNGHIIVQIV